MVGVSGGNPMVVADVNDVLLYLPRWTTKSAATSRNTTTTLTDDPDLSGIPLEIGIFEIEVVAFFTLSTTTTQKLRTQWGFSGTWNGTTIRGSTGPGQANTAATDNATESNFRGHTLDTQTADYDVSTSGAYATVREICGTVQVTAAGNFGWKWSQAASSGNNTNVQSGSFVRVTRKRS